jgi:hypothetical protein
MNQPSMPFAMQALVTIGGCVAVIAFVWWQARREGKEFHVFRVLAIMFLAALSSLPFIAAFWWLTPKDTEWRNNPYTLAAWSVPLFALNAWGLIHFGRKLRQKKRDE